MRPRIVRNLVQTRVLNSLLIRNFSLFAAAALVALASGCGGDNREQHNAAAFRSCVEDAGGVTFAFADGSEIAPNIDWAAFSREMPGGIAASFPDRDEFLLFYVADTERPAEIAAQWADQQSPEMAASRFGDLVIVTKTDPTAGLESIVDDCRSSAAKT